MKIEFENINNVYFAIFILFVFLMYQYNSLLKNKKNNYKYILIILRSNILFLLLLFLFNPTMHYSKDVLQKQKINLFIDNSKSNLENIKKNNINIKSIYNNIDAWAINHNVIIDLFLFGDSVRSINNYDNIKYQDKSTNFTFLFDFIKHLEIKDDIIILSDGVNNAGYNKIEKSKNIIHAIGVGKEKSATNLIIEKIEINSVQNDSLYLDFIIDVKTKNNLSNNNIILSNEFKDARQIHTFDIKDGEYLLNENIRLSKDILSDNNIFSIEINSKDTYFKNNNYHLKLDDQYYNKIKILLITGTLSSNTKVIKNQILNKIKNVEINHLYNTDNRWNTDSNNIDIDLYNLIVYDNFPMSTDDYKFYNSLNISKNTYFFLGPYNQSYTYNFINENGCILKLSKNSENKSNYFDNFDVDLELPQKELDYFILCDEKNQNLNFKNNSTFFSRNENVSMFFYPDLFELNQSMKLNNKSKNYIYKYIYNMIEESIFKRNKYIDIYSSKRKYTNKELIEIYYQTNNDIVDSMYYIKVKDYKNNIVEYNKYSMLDTNLYLFDLNMNKVGKYNITGYVKNNDEILNSNTINIDILEDDFELTNIFLDNNYLENIALNNSGDYVSYKNVNNLLDVLETQEYILKEKESKYILSYKFIWIILIMLFLSEWLIRNRIGLL